MPVVDRSYRLNDPRLINYRKITIIVQHIFSYDLVNFTIIY